MLNRAHLRAQSSAHLREHVYQPTSSRSCLILRLIISFDIWHRFLDILLRWEYMAVVADMKTNSSFIILSTALENVGSQTQRGPVARFSLLGRLMGWHTEGQLLGKFSGMWRIIVTHGDTHREHGLECCTGLGPHLEACLLQLWNRLKRLSLGHNRKERGVGGT